MNETIKIWLIKLYTDTIEEVRDTIKNEHIFELGYNGNDINPHTENIKTLNEYIGVLENLIRKLELED